MQRTPQVRRTRNRGDTEVRVELFDALQEMARNPARKQQARTLGAVMVRVLAGDPDPSGLPPELAAAVREMLDA